MLDFPTVPGEAENHVPHAAVQPDDWDLITANNSAGTKEASQTSHAEEPEIDGSGSSIMKSLQSWAVSHHITQTAVTSLLKMLKKHQCFNKFPSDARALLKTPRLPGAEIVDRGSGEY